MRTIFLVLVVIFIAGCTGQTGHKQTEVKVGNVTIMAEIADTSEERRQGLMWRDSLPEGEGMLFIFPSEAHQSFWMKNTRMPLDLIFVSENKTAAEIKADFRPCSICETYTSTARAKYVLEVSGGFAQRNNIKVGNRVIFDLHETQNRQV